MALFRKVAFIFALIFIVTMVEAQDDEETEAPETEAPAAEEPPAAAAEEPPAAAAEGDAANEITSPDAAVEYKGPPKTELTTPMEWVEAAIKKHNEYRAQHGAGPLVFNKTLAEISQAYANEIAKTFKVEHNPDAQKARLGENLYYSSNTDDFELKPEKGVTAWYDEVKEYDYKTTQPKDGKSEILHFTQLVWKTTTDVGIAFAKTFNEAKGMHTVYVVANYSPRGNFDSFQENVVPKSGDGSADKGNVDGDNGKETSGAGCRNHLISGTTLGMLFAGILSFSYVYYYRN